MRFKVKQRGHKEQEWKHKRLTQAVSFFARTLRIPNPKLLDITLKMSFNRKMVEEGHRGNCSPIYPEKDSLFEDFIPNLPSKFTITMQGDMPWTWTLTTFAHEMVHAHQLATGKLRIAKINGEWQYSWMGGEWVIPLTGGGPGYREQPWEAEAYAREKNLCDAFFKVEEPTGILYQEE